MRVTVIPASMNIGRATITALLADPSAPAVIGVYRDLAKVPADFKKNPRFQAVQGDVSDISTLDFSGADVVVTATPPQYGESDPVALARLHAQNVEKAIEKAASVRRLVYISSGGAQHENGTGEIKTNWAAEQELRDAAPEIVFIRCAYFMENWAMGLKTLKEDSPFFYSVMSPADYAMPMVSSTDIGKMAATQAVGPSPLKVDPYIIDLHGPREYSPLDVKKAWEEVLGKEVDVKVVELANLETYFGQFLPPAVTDLFVEMTKSFHPGGILYEEPIDPASEVHKGKETLTEAFRRIVSS